MKRKCVMMAGVMLLMTAAATGCGSGKETDFDGEEFVAERVIIEIYR